MDETPNLGLPYIMAAQSQKHVTHNEAIRALDAVVQLSVLDRSLSAPPDSPADGARYIIASSPTGGWSGHAGAVAAWQDGAWMFYVPHEGWIAWVADEDAAVVWSGSAWVALTTGGGGGDPGPNPEFDTVAINGATADTTNRLSINAPATLLNHAGAGHQLKINKAAAGDTASLLYQTAFSGRAEMGLAGDDDFHFKVSPDGSAWNEAIVIDKDTGEVSFPNTSLGGGGAPTDAEYIVKSASGGLSAERVLTDTATVTWDYATGGQAKGNVPNDAITYAKLQNVSATDKLLGRSTAGAGDVEEIACTAFARSVLDDADAATARATLGLAIGTNVQAYDADLTTWAGLTPSANAQSLVTAANYAAMRALLDLEAGTDFYSKTAADAAFQPIDSDLTAIAAIAPTNDDVVQRKAGAWTNRTLAQLLADLGAFTGDSGSGGVKGLVPAPGAGDAAASKFLKANGSWAVPSSGREFLIADRTYYVRADGSNSNNGLANTSGGAFLTIQKAYDVITSTLDLGGKTVTIQVGSGTFTGGLSVAQPWTGGGSVILQGDTTTPANVIISTTSASCIATTAPLPGALTAQGFELRTTTAGSGIDHAGGGNMLVGAMRYGACANAHMQVASGCYLGIVSNYTISGNASQHWNAFHGGFIQCDFKTITLSGTPAFSSAFAMASNTGKIETIGNTFSGSGTGTRYAATTNAVINTNSAGASALPGNAAGSTGTGGQYV